MKSQWVPPLLSTNENPYFAVIYGKRGLYRQHILVVIRFINPLILQPDLGDHCWRKTSQILSHFNPNVWLFRHGAPSQFNPGLGNGLIPNVLIANQQLSLTKKTPATGGVKVIYQSIYQGCHHFKLQCSDLRTIARTNSVFGK